ncbi:MAG: hypothetical protein ACYS7Y_04005 [Planctomycetota bacterium]|jgi:hypothetical protein
MTIIKRLQNAPRLVLRTLKAFVDQYETQEVEDFIDRRVREEGLEEVYVPPDVMMEMLDNGRADPVHAMETKDSAGFYR